VTLLAGFLHRLCPRVAPGSYALHGSPEVTRWLLHYSIENLLRLPGVMGLVLANPLLRRMHFALAGARIHRRTRLSYECRLLDPYLVAIGEGSKVGAFTRFIGHYSDERRFVIGTITVGRNVLIGGDSDIGPGVVIGDGSMVQGKSLVLPFTVIPPGEIWGGSPARFRKRLEAGAAASAG
jgi:acetyltransferase-like isoleucine patch superfamily enzyme